MRLVPGYKPHSFSYGYFELLDKLMKGEKLIDSKRTIKKARIEIRESSDTADMGDTILTNAMSFIRTNAQKAIKVNDVVNLAAISRRNLEQRFRKVLGITILDEIIRVRIDHIARMLVETNMPIWQIASIFGHTSPKNLARYFKKQKRMTPLRYREKFKLK